MQSLGLMFRRMESFDGGSKVSSEDFMTGMNQIGVQLSKSESYV